MSISKASPNFVHVEPINKYKSPKESVKQTDFPFIHKINTESTMEVSHDNPVSAATDSNESEPEENRNVDENTTLLCIENHQTDAVIFTNKCCEENISTAVQYTNVEKCGPACRKFSVKAPTMVPCVAVLPNRPWRSRYCEPTEYYIQGHCYFLHRLQQKGKNDLVFNTCGK
jgi:hypothetical protein